MSPAEEAAFRALPAAVVVVEHGRAVFGNDRATALLGSAPASVLAPFDEAALRTAAEESSTLGVAVGGRSSFAARVSRLDADAFVLVLEPSPGLASRTRDELEVLLRMASASGGLDQPRQLADAMEVIARATGADLVVLFERAAGGLRAMVSSGASPEEERALERVTRAEDDGADEPLARSRGELPGEASRALEAAGLAHALVMPVRGAGEAFGRLVAGRRSQRPFGDDERAVLQAFGASLGGALAHSRLYRESSRQVHDLQSLFELGRAVAGERDLPRVFRLAARTAAAICGAHEVFILTVEPSSDGALLALRACLHEGFEPPPAHAAREEVAHELVGRARELAWTAMRQQVAVAEASVLPPETGHLAAAPLVSGERPLGCLVALRLVAPFGARPPAFEQTDVQRLRAVADYVAMALQSGQLFQDQQRRVRELSLLNEVAAECAELGLDRLVPTATQRLCRAVGAELAALFFFDPAREELVLGAVASPVGPVAGVGAHPTLAPGLALRALSTRQPRRGPISELGLPALEALAKERDLAHATLVPLFAKDRAIGLVLTARAARPATDDELRLLVALCAEIAVAVENARLYAEAKRQAADLELVREVGDVVARSLEPRHVLREAVVKLAEALEADAARVYLREGDGYRSAVDFGFSEQSARAGDFVPKDDPLLVRLVGVDEPLALATAELADPTRRYVRSLGLSRLAMAPLRIRAAGKSSPSDHGALVVGRRAGRAFAPGELKVIGAVASQLAVALANARLYDETRQNAEDLSIVAEAGRALVGEAPLGEALDAVATRLARLIGVRTCLVFLRDRAAASLRVGGASEGTSEEARGMLVPLSAASSVSARAVAARQATLDPDFARNAFAPYVARAFGWLPVWTFGLPLMSGEEPVGVVVLTDDVRHEPLGAADSARVAAIASQVASAIERSRLNEALERSLEELEKAQEKLVRRERLAALGELAALVAHEVRNPLGVIFNSLGSLGKLVELEGDARRLYDLIGEEADRLNRIVGDMLDYTRPTEPHLRPGALDRVLNDAVQSATTSEQNRGTPVEEIAISVQLAPLPAVPMDERLVHQALVNLLSNALQSVGKGGHVRVRAHVDRANDRAVARIEVEDDGPGIPPEATGRLFEPFFTTKANGSGLGLAVVKRIVDGHRGEVTVRTRPGEGTTFVVDLPL